MKEKIKKKEKVQAFQSKEKENVMTKIYFEKKKTQSRILNEAGTKKKLNAPVIYA